MTYTGPDTNDLPQEVATTVIDVALPEQLDNPTRSRHIHAKLHARTNKHLRDGLAALLEHINDGGLHAGAPGGSSSLAAMTDVDMTGLAGSSLLRFDADDSLWHARLAPAIDVTDYGVTLGATADSAILDANTAALNALLAVAALAGGYSVFFAGIVYVNGDIIMDAAASADQIHLVGAHAGCGIFDTRTAGTTLRLLGAGGAVCTDCSLTNMRIDGVTAGANTRVALALTDVERFTLDRVEIANANRAITADNLRAFLGRSSRFVSCGRTAAPTEGVVNLTSPSAGRTCENITFFDCEWRDCVGLDLDATSTNERISRVMLIASRFLCGGTALRSGRVRINKARFVVCAWNHFRAGTPAAAVAAQNVLDITDCTHAQVFANSFEGASIAAGLNPIRTFIRFNGCDHAQARDNGFDCGNNNNPTVAAIEWVGTNNDATDMDNGFGTIAGGTPVFRTGRPTTLASRWRASSIRFLTASATLTNEDELVYVDATLGDVTVTLASLADLSHPVTIKRFDGTANAVTVAAPAQTIDGAATYLLPVQYGWVQIGWFGLTYIVIGAGPPSGDVIIPPGTPPARSSRTVVGDTAITVADDVIFVNPSAVTVTLTLPAIAQAPKVVSIKRIDFPHNYLRTVVVATADAGLIDGAATISLENPLEGVELMHDGTNWHTV